jgi:hypothetical protein
MLSKYGDFRNFSPEKSGEFANFFSKNPSSDWH